MAKKSLAASEVKITDAESMIEAISLANDEFTGQVWWRGQRCSCWELSPSVFRRDLGYEYEQNIAVRFQQRAPIRHPRVLPIHDRHGWLSIMQHYRLPTRMLDWTESPLVACLFASESGICRDLDDNECETQAGAVYALSPYKLNEDQIDEHALLMPEHAEVKALIDRAFNSEVEDQEYVVAFRPSEEDIRMMLQLSVFTIHGSGKAIDDLPNEKEFTLKFEIPDGEKVAVRKALKNLGIRESNLFPDLEHLADEVSDVIFRPSPTPPSADPDIDDLNLDTWPRNTEASS